MPSIVRRLLLLFAVLLVPVVPFVIFGEQLEERMGQWVERWASPWDTAVLVVGLLTTDILLPVPSSLVSTMGGMRLGWLYGTLASWTGMSAGATLGFALARYGRRAIAQRLAKPAELERIERLSLHYGPMLLVMTRAVPVLAEACVLWMGLEEMPWRRFLPAVLLSNLGIALAYSAFGDLAAQYKWLPLASGISLALPLLLTMAAMHFTRARTGTVPPGESST